MPKETFHNLKPEKKEAIETAAVNEFAKYGYFNAKISRIAAEGKFAVGSFYQYFDDINDLFMHVFGKIADRKIGYIKAELKQCKNDNFEEKIRAICKGGIKFAIEEPDCFQIGNTFMAVSKTPAFEKLMKYHIISEKNDWLEDIVKQAIEDGDIRKDMTIELFMLLFISILSAILDYMGILESKEKFTEENMIRMTDMAVDVLFRGISQGEEK